MLKAPSKPIRSVSGKRFCKATRSAPSPQPASSTRCGSILTNVMRSNMRADTSRRKKSDSATRAGSANNRRTNGKSIGALNLALALGVGKDMKNWKQNRQDRKETGSQSEIIAASVVEFAVFGIHPAPIGEYYNPACK